MKNIFVFVVLIFSTNAAMARDIYLDHMDKDGILRMKDGSPVMADQKEAIEACASFGMHLPTIREFAVLAQSQGATGILEKSTVANGQVPPGYYRIQALSLDGVRDEFYFNQTGYVRPRGHLGFYHFWTSSLNFEQPYYFYTFESDTARLPFGNIGGVVRCFPNH